MAPSTELEEPDLYVPLGIYKDPKPPPKVHTTLAESQRVQELLAEMDGDP